MSKAGQAETTREQFDGIAGGMVRQFEPKNVTLQHTYLIDLKGKSPGRVVCATDLSKPEGWESLSAADVPEQAHVLLSADTRNNKLAFVVWLVPEQSEWKVQSFRLNISTLAEKDSLQLWELARTQQARSLLSRPGRSSSWRGFWFLAPGAPQSTTGIRIAVAGPP